MKRITDRKSGQRSTLLLTVLVFGLVLTCGTAIANDVHQSTATATILAALAITETQPLNFGDVWMGVSKAIDSATMDLGAGAGGSGLWIIAGTAGDNIQMSFLLPEYLWSTTVKQRIDIFFKETDASYQASAVTNPTFATGTWAMKNPYAMGTLAFTEASIGVGLGGTVYPSATQQAAADYEGTIILTCWFEGS
jgi:hypothetical protein